MKCSYRSLTPEDYYKVARNALETAEEARLLFETMLRINFRCPQSLSQVNDLICEALITLKKLHKETCELLENFEALLFPACPIINYLYVVGNQAEVQYLIDILDLYTQLNLCNDEDLCFLISNINDNNTIIDRIVNQSMTILGSLVPEEGSYV